MTVSGKYSGQFLPNGWRWVKLKETGVFEAGGTPAKERIDYWNGEIPFVTGADITELYISKVNARAFLTRDGLYSGKTVICEAGTVIIVTRTRVGRSGIAQETIGASQDITAFKCGPEIHQEFLCRYLHNISEHLVDNCRGATIQGLTREFIDYLEIPLPPLPEQRRIAGVLREQMAAVENARAAAYDRLEAVKALPVAFLRQIFPQPGQPLPGGWRWVRMGDMCDRIDYGYTASADVDVKTPKFLRITDIQNNKVNWDSVPGCTILDADEDANRLEDGDIVFTRTGATTGKSYLISKPPRSVFASYLIRVKSHREHIEPDYLFAFFQSDGYWKQISAGARGGAQPGFNATMLAALKIPLPPLSEQKRIAAILKEQMAVVETVRAAAEEELNTINALPAALLRRAFNGEL